MNFRVLGVVAAFATCSISADAFAQCMSDDQCKGDRICVDGKCVYPEQAPRPGAKKKPATKPTEETPPVPESSGSGQTPGVKTFDLEGAGGEQAQPPAEPKPPPADEWQSQDNWEPEKRPRRKKRRERRRRVRQDTYPDPDYGAPRRTGGFQGTHGFFGLTFAPGPLLPIDSDVFFAMLPAFHGGILLGSTEFAAELGPIIVPDLGTAFAPTVTVGSYLGISDLVHVPLRVGVGGFVGDLDGFQARIDLGLAFHFGRFLFEVTLPSFRYGTDFDAAHAWAWLISLRGSFVI